MSGGNMDHLVYLCRHKLFVLVAGLRLRVPLWQLLVHDLTKLLPCEWAGYRDHLFLGEDTRWQAAWNHHQKHNPHHWEYWLLFDDRGARPLPMPLKYVREMVADWLGANRAQHGTWDIADWVVENAGKMFLHPLTARRLVEVLWEQGMATAAGAVRKANPGCVPAGGV